MKCLFLGYATTKRGYRCFDPVNWKLYIAKDESYYTSLQGENSTEALSWKIPQSPFLVPKLPATSPVSTQISPSIPFVQSNPTIVRVHDRLSNAWEDKALPPTTQSTPQFKVC